MADKVSIKKEERAKIPIENIYTVDEFIKAAKTLFGVKPECVAAAFFAAKKDKATQGEAKKIVLEFMSREVK